MPCRRPAPGRTRQERRERPRTARPPRGSRHRGRQPAVQPGQRQDRAAGARTAAGTGAVRSRRGAERRSRHRERRGTPGAFGRPGQAGAHRRTVPSGGGDARRASGGVAPRRHPAAVRGERRQPGLPGLLRPGGDAEGHPRLRDGGRGQAAQVPHRLRPRPPGRGHQDRHRGGRRVRRGSVPRERGAGQPRESRWSSPRHAGGRESACCSTGRWRPRTAHPSTRRSWPGSPITTITARGQRSPHPMRTRRPPARWPTPTRERSAGPGRRRRGHSAAVAGSPSGAWCRAWASGPTCTALPPNSPWPDT